MGEEYSKLDCIEKGKAILGIELGSTRIKAVLIDQDNRPIESGSHHWENKLIDGIWTYSEDEIWQGIQCCYKNLVDKVYENYGVYIKKLSAIGISGMMHGYLPFDKNNNLIVEFRTWRNNITAEASEKLTTLFDYNIPQRWSIAHLYQEILNGKNYINDINYMTTLAGYIHWKLTGEKVLGIGDASGMFPIDKYKTDFDENMIYQFNEEVRKNDYCLDIKAVLPKVVVAGQEAGKLTKEGVNLLDTSGNLEPGIKLCPPEGDAGTGMIATNTISERTGNVSAGTSVFATIVLENELSKVYKDLDIVTTPDGKFVAMAHSNNCTTDLNAWIKLFKEVLSSFGINLEDDKIYEVLYKKALDGEVECGGLLSYCYHSGEHSTGFSEGRPLFVRNPNSNFNLENFMKVQLYTALAGMKTGLDILMKTEKVKIDKILAHGGFFKTKKVGQKIMASATGVPVYIMETAGEGGAWGIALLASYMVFTQEQEVKLDEFLNNYIFVNSSYEVEKPNIQEVEGFEIFMKRYRDGLVIERAAVENI